MHLQESFVLTKRKGEEKGIKSVWKSREKIATEKNCLLKRNT